MKKYLLKKYLLKKYLYLPLLALILFNSGCDTASCVASPNKEIQAEFEFPSMKITNTSDHEICFRVFGRKTSTWIKWAPNWDDENKLKPQESRTITVLADDDNVWLLHWWDKNINMQVMEVSR